MTSSTVEGQALAMRAATFAVGVLAEVADADLARPTPCTDWDVHDLLLHIADASDLLASVAATGEPGPSQTRAMTVTAPAALAAERIQHLLDQLAESPPTDWVHQATYGAAIELTTHACDLAAALGSSTTPPDALADDVHALATTLISDDARQPHFGPRIDAAPDAAPAERLMNFLGRSAAR